MGAIAVYEICCSKPLTLFIPIGCSCDRLQLFSIGNETITPGQCKAARSLLDMKQDKLCELADVAIKTLSDFEGGKTKPYGTILEKIQAALEDAGALFVDPNGLGAE